MPQEEECEHLRQIIKELSHARHVVAKTKVEMEEQYVALQKEYLRWVRWKSQIMVNLVVCCICISLPVMCDKSNSHLH